MTIKVRPIGGDEPGLCEAIRDGQPCVEEGVVVATVPIPGLDDVTVEVVWCRRDWADVHAAEELDLCKVRPAGPPKTGRVPLGGAEV